MNIIFKTVDQNYTFHHFACQTPQIEFLTPNQISNHCKYFCWYQSRERVWLVHHLSKSAPTLYEALTVSDNHQRRIHLLDLKFQDDFQADPASLPCQYGNGIKVLKAAEPWDATSRATPPRPFRTCCTPTVSVVDVLAVAEHQIEWLAGARPVFPSSLVTISPRISARRWHLRSHPMDKDSGCQPTSLENQIARVMRT